MKLPFSLRTVEGELAYKQAKEDGLLLPLTEEPTLREWTHWRIINNRFPYDSVLITHHMLLTKAVVPDRSHLTDEERLEFDRIIRQIEPEYDFIMENFAKRRSILDHYHLHLGVYKDER